MKAAILLSIIIAFLGGAFVMETWHANNSRVNAQDIRDLQVLLLRKNQEQLAQIQELRAEVESLELLLAKHDSGRM